MDEKDADQRGGGAPAGEEKPSLKQRFIDSITLKIVNRPILFLSCTVGFIITLTIIAAAAGMLVNSEQTNYDWTISDGRASEQFDAVDFAQDQDTSVTNNTRTEDILEYAMWITFASSVDGNIFTPENVQSICQIEQLYIQTPGYEDVCLLNNTGGTTKCSDPTSTVTYYFYGNSDNETCALLSSSDVNSTATFMYNQLDASNASRLLYGFFMDSETMTRSPYYSTRTRTRIPIGGPLVGYRNTNDNLEDQKKEYTKFIKRVKDRFFDKFGMKQSWLRSAYRTEVSTNGLKVRFNSLLLRDLDWIVMLDDDLNLAAFSIIFVFSWMCYHLGSLFLASMGMLQIVLSLPVSIVIYRGVYQIQYFTALHGLTIFLVLGIGADDVFVFIDGWRQAHKVVERDGIPQTSSEYLIRRMRLAYVRTLAAVFDTSFTTIVAFLATAISPIMPVATFGMFAATAIFINYVLVMTLIPAAVVCHYKYLEYRTCCCFGDKNLDIQVIQDDEDGQAQDGQAKATKPAPIKTSLMTTAEGSTGDAPRTEQSASTNGLRDAPKDTKTNLLDDTAARVVDSGAEAKDGAAPPADDDEEETAVTPIDRLFHTYYIPCMKFRPSSPRLFLTAILVAVGLFSYGIFMVSQAAQLGTPDEAEQWFPDDHMMTGFEQSLSNDYMAGPLGDYVIAKVPFGITGISRPDYNKYDPAKNRGDTVFDDAFDLYPEASQNAFLSACTLARSYVCNEGACREGKLVWPTSTGLLCFLEDYQTWFADNNPGFTTYNCSRDQFFTQLKLFRNTTTSTTLTTGKKQELIGFINGDLKFAIIEMTMTLLFESSVKDKEGVRGVADNLAKDINAQSPSGMQSSFAASHAWIWLEIEAGLVEGFFRGLAICFPMAFFMLMIATSNFILSFYAVLSIGMIVSCVLGMCKYYLGWQLGTGEAIAGIIVIGFSVDYVIHLGHMYVDAGHKGTHDRVGRFTYAAEKMAGTVFAGAVTTFGAGIPLFFCQLTFFTKMGTLVSSTIAYSIVYSLGFFMSLCLLIGPTGAIGQVRWAAEKTGLAAFVRAKFGWEWGLQDQEKMAQKGGKAQKAQPLNSVVVGGGASDTKQATAQQVDVPL